MNYDRILLGQIIFYLEKYEQTITQCNDPECDNHMSCHCNFTRILVALLYSIASQVPVDEIIKDDLILVSHDILKRAQAIFDQSVSSGLIKIQEVQ